MTNEERFGVGDSTSDTRPSFISPSKYWDLGAFLKEGQYSDWEGFTDGAPIKERVLKVLKVQDPKEETEINKLCLDLVIHYAFENEDQAGYTLTDEEIHTTYWAYQYLFDGGSRYMAKTDQAEETEHSEG